MQEPYTLTPFDPLAADDEALRPLWELNRVLRAEQYPDDEPLPFAAYLAFVRAQSRLHELRVILAQGAGGELAGRTNIFLSRTGDNPHVARVQVEVRPEHRRRGLGRRLLAAAAQVAREDGRSMLHLGSDGQVPAGAAFLAAVGARRAQENRISRLLIADLDRGLLRAWQERAAERAPGFELLFWDTTVPEEHEAAFAGLIEAMNTAPHDDLEVEPERWTPERVREAMRSVRASGSTLWTLVARERSSGALAGYTEMYHHPARPRLALQGDTAVDPAFRNRGLGRWLKAAMLERVLRDLPGVESIRTGNAESNAPMLAINVALGFRPYRSAAYWQLEIADCRLQIAD